MSLPLTEERMQALRLRLLQEKNDLQERMRHNDHYQLSATLRESVDELSTYDNHPGDLGTETFERSKDFSLLERDGFRLERIESALERMDSGEYGRCSDCGVFISPERLEAMPAAAYCVEHEPRADTSYRRPVEEKVMRYPFGRSDEDSDFRNDNWVGFDGEDAWQILASYGTSNTPALSDSTDNVASMSDYDSVHIEAGENEGFVEAIESFLATDITGRRTYVVRNREYFRYLKDGEGDDMLEPDEFYDET